MRKIISLEKINSVTVDLIDKLKIIEDTKKELEININKITDYYKGQDAEIIKNKYLEEANKLNTVIFTFESYINYFKWLTQSYGECLKNTINNFSSLIESINILPQQEETTDFITKTLVLNNDLNSKE